MALGIFAKRLHRAHAQLSLTSILTSLPFQCIPFSSATHHVSYHLIQAFYQTGILPCRPTSQCSYFSTLQQPHSHNLCNPFSFSEYIDETHQHEQSGLSEFVELLKSAKNHLSNEDEEAMADLDKSGINPNTYLVYSGIWALRDHWELAFLAFKWGERRGCNIEKTWILMIWVLGNHKKFGAAWNLIRELHRCCSQSTRQAMLIMIDRYAAANSPGKAIQTFQFMEKFKLSPDPEAFYLLLTALCRHGNIEEAEEFMLMNKKLFPLETEGFNIILNGWCNITVDMFEAKRIWREMSKCCILPNADSYTCMISCFAKVGNLFDSLRLYDEMKKRGFAPGLEVYNSLIQVLTHENCLNEALKIVDRVKKIGMQPDSATYNSMILPLCEAGNLEEARSILATMIAENVSPTTETYHAFLHVASLEGTLEVLTDMRRTGLGPSKNTFLLLLDKFFKLVEPDNALKIWEEMKHHRVLPDSAHYTVLVLGLAESGLLVKAREFYAEMRSNGMPDDPKLMKLLKEPVEDNSHCVGEKAKKIVRRKKNRPPKHHGKSSKMTNLVEKTRAAN